jgi:peptide/nickel transport system permease protein
MKALARTLREFKRYPSAVAGLAIILILLLVAVYTVFAIPYQEAIRLWRGGEEVWYKYPKNAAPAWTNLFRSADLPATIFLNSAEDEAVTTENKVVTEEMNQTIITFPVDFPYEAFPQEIIVYFTSTYEAKKPHINLEWIRPDGEEVQLGSFSVRKDDSYRLSQDQKIQRKYGGVPGQIALFAVDPNADTLVPQPGHYEMRVTATLFEPGSDVESEFILYGDVYGVAGTDHLRRDLRIALLWGLPIALAFGILAAVGTTLITMLIAAVGVWFNGWLDEMIQRITEVNLVLPFLPILIMVGTFYSRSIWVILGVSILLSIFGAGIKSYRAIFLQVKESPYIEAARSYGAGSWRIVLTYLVPRIIPILIPQLVAVIPTFVFLEASLAVLGLGDPVLPTWGKIIDDAYSNGALFRGQYYWVLEPSFLLMLTGLAFAMVGFALDRIFNPRLRGL